MSKDNKKIAKYATVTFKYYENEDSPTGNALRLMNNLASTISSYNTNSAKHGYSAFELVWFSVDPDEMNIDEQNNLYNEYTEKINGKSRK